MDLPRCIVRLRCGVAVRGAAVRCMHQPSLPFCRRMKGDWVQVYDANHDRDYWNNSRTGESRWTEPEDVDMPGASEPTGSSAAGSSEGSKGKSPDKAGTKQGASKDGGEDERGRAASTMMLDNPMTKARAARVAREAAADSTDSKAGGTRPPTQPPADEGGPKKKTAPSKSKTSKPLTVSVASPLQSGLGGSGRSGGSPSRSPSPGRRASAMSGASGALRKADSFGSGSGGAAKGGLSRGATASKMPSATPKLTGAAARRAKRNAKPSYTRRRRKRDKWRAQRCASLQQSLYTLTIFGMAFTSYQEAARIVLLLGIFLGVGEAMMETYDDRPSVVLLTLAESVYVFLFMLEYAARLWSCHPLAFEEFDGTPDQQKAQASATFKKRSFYWLLYHIVWPFHLTGMLCNPEAAGEAQYRWQACCGQRRRAFMAWREKGHCDEWDEPLPFVAGCIPWHEEVAGAGAFWQRVHFALRPSSLFDLMQILPLLLQGIAPDEIKLFATTRETTYIGAIFRMLRVMRVLKFIRYIPTMAKLIAGIRTVRNDLFTSLTAAVIVAILLAAGAHIAEQHENAEFSSLPKALWGMVITLTTVGYGDLFPTSKEGKMISGLASIAGIGLFTIPSATVARGFQTHAAELKARREKAVAKLLRLYRGKKMRLSWKKWVKQAELAAMADRMADPNSRKAQLYYRRNLARELLRLCALELGTCLETVSKAVSERQRFDGMMRLGMEVGGGVDGVGGGPPSPRRGTMSPRRMSSMASSGRL